MGNLVWHDLARFISITASIYGIWAAYWGLFFRKFFFDFVRGTIRNPGGIQPAKGDAIFVTLIVKAPVIQILAMISASSLLALEMPVPFIKGTAIHRSLILRVVALLNLAVLSILYYQGTNCAVWSLVAALAYTRAIVMGETMAEAKANKGKAGTA